MSRIPPELDAEMTPAVRAFVLTLLGRIDELEQQVQKLTPQNSSIPPSTVHPHAKAKPKPKAKAGKRKRGGQKGHKRHQRDLVPVEDCTTVTHLHPEGCRRCGGELNIRDTDPIRHQVWELPPITPIIDEYRLHRGHCPGCGITTAATLPPGVPTMQCGPRLAAFTGLLMGHFRQSKRRTAAFLGDLSNVPASPAWTVKIQNVVAESIRTPCDQLRGELEKQPQLSA